MVGKRKMRRPTKRNDNKLKRRRSGLVSATAPPLRTTEGMVEKPMTLFTISVVMYQALSRGKTPLKME